MSGLPPEAAVQWTFRNGRFVRIVLQKSPSGLCEIEICNYRIGAPVLLNRCCAFQPDLESIFLAEMLKILLQHNLPEAAVSRCSNRRAEDLFDHLVGAGEQRWRHVEAEHLRRSHIDDQLEPGRLHDRQIRRFLALEDAPGIDADLTIPVCIARSVAHQNAGFGKLPASSDCGQHMARGPRRKLYPTVDEHWVGTDNKCIGPLLHKARKGRVDTAIGTGGEDLDLPPNSPSRRLH